MSSPGVFRSLARARGLSLAIIAMLAIGTGALTSSFALVDAALIRQPPFADARRLTMLYMVRASPRIPERRERWSYPRIQLLRQLTTVFDAVSNYSPAALRLTGIDEPEGVDGEIVGADYFRVLRVGAIQGRTFVADDHGAPGAHPIALLSFELWQRRFGGDSVVGRTIGVGGASLTIVGVLPRGFRGLSGRSELWIPSSLAPVLTYDEYLTTNQNFISVVARLRPDVDVERAQAELRVIGSRIDAAIPSARSDSAETMSATAVALNEARVDPTTRRSVLLLLAAVALLHLLASANTASLLLGRAAGRRHEAAIRSALGGDGARLLRYYLADGALLAALGGALGVLLAAWVGTIGVVPVDVWGPRGFYGSLAAFADTHFDVRSILFGAGVTAVTMLLVAWPPAAYLSRVNVIAGLRDGARGADGGGLTWRRPSVRAVIVSAECALAIMLLIAGGLMIDSFRRMRGTDLGVDPDRVLTFRIQPSDVDVPPIAAPPLISRLLSAITAVPGVIAASVDGGAPVSGSARSVLHIVGRPEARPDDTPGIDRHYVGPDHFRTLGIPVRRGRAFTERDVAGSPKVAIISESAARRFWPNEDPLGQRVWFGSSGGFTSADSSAEIVGVVGDVVYESLDVQRNASSFYTPYAQFTYSWRIYFVRTAGDPTAVVPAIRRAVRGVDANLPLFEVQTLSHRIGESWARHRFDAVLFGGFAAIALLLAATGIFASVAYAISQRTREMGTRLALGAQPSQVIRLVVREGLAFPVAGLVVGVAASLALTRFIRASLYGVTATDPRIFALTALVLLAVSALACVLPARRVTRIDPLEALRHD